MDTTKQYTAVEAMRMALQHIRICAPDPTVDAALESALFPQAASEGLQRALTGALDRLDAYFPAGHTRKHDVAEVRMLVERIAPAIAPSGDGMSAWIGKLGALVSAAKDRDLSAKDHAEAIDNAHSELFDTLRSLSAAGNAVTVDDAMVERARWARMQRIVDLRADHEAGRITDEQKQAEGMRAAITAALAPAAQQEGAVRAATREEEAEIDEAAELTKVAFRMPDDLLGVVDAQAAREGLIRVAMIRTLIKRGLSSENVVAPADPPAAGDATVVAWEWPDATVTMELRQQLAAAIAERERAVNAIKAHNADYGECDKKKCGYAPYKYRECPECPAQHKIDLAAIAAGGEGAGS